MSAVGKRDYFGDFDENGQLVEIEVPKRPNAAQRKAAVICRHCPVMLQCGADALDNRVEFGVWGGMTERERRALLRRRSNVTSWRELLMNARKEYDRLDPVAFVSGR